MQKHAIISVKFTPSCALFQLKSALKGPEKIDHAYMIPVKRNIMHPATNVVHLDGDFLSEFSIYLSFLKIYSKFILIPIPSS